jgi:hypothetical protein
VDTWVYTLTQKDTASSSDDGLGKLSALAKLQAINNATKTGPLITSLSHWLFRNLYQIIAVL